MVRTTHTKFLDWGDWGRVERVGKHLSNFKKHAYQLCSKEGKLQRGEVGRGDCRINRKPEICSFCGEVLALTWLFFQAGGCCVACYRKIFVLLHFVWKLVISRTCRHKNQRTVSHIFVSANNILKKMWRYRILRIQRKFAKSLENVLQRKVTVPARYNKL